MVILDMADSTRGCDKHNLKPRLRMDILLGEQFEAMRSSQGGCCNKVISLIRHSSALCRSREVVGGRGNRVKRFKPNQDTEDSSRPWMADPLSVQRRSISIEQREDVRHVLYASHSAGPSCRSE